VCGWAAERGERIKSRNNDVIMTSLGLRKKERERERTGSAWAGKFSTKEEHPRLFPPLLDSQEP